MAVGDYDLDGNLDIFKTHFTEDTNVLYRNDDKGFFTDVTIRAGRNKGLPPCKATEGTSFVRRYCRRSQGGIGSRRAHSFGAAGVA